MKDFKPVNVPGLPRFYGGLVGFFSYEVINQIEKIKNTPEKDISFPDSCFMLTDSVVIFDNINKSAKIVINVHLKEKVDIKKVYNKSLKQISMIEKLLKKSVKNPYGSKSISKKLRSMLEKVM